MVGLFLAETGTGSQQMALDLAKLVLGIQCQEKRHWISSAGKNGTGYPAPVILDWIQQKRHWMALDGQYRQKWCWI